MVSGRWMGTTPKKGKVELIAESEATESHWSNLSVAWVRYKVFPSLKRAASSGSETANFFKNPASKIRGNYGQKGRQKMKRHRSSWQQIDLLQGRGFRSGTPRESNMARATSFSLNSCKKRGEGQGKGV